MKSKDLSDLKWKMNDSLELKRRVEMDNETMKFELENLRSRYVADMKEKYIFKLFYLILLQGFETCPTTEKL